MIEREISADACLSADELFRYSLTRWWGDLPPSQPEKGCGRWAVFIMLNPSTADARQDDPTIRRCIAFADAWGYKGLCVLNLYAFRSSDPTDLIYASDAVGPNNDLIIVKTLQAVFNHTEKQHTGLLPFRASPPAAYVAWGVADKHRNRAARVLSLIRRCHFEPLAIRVTQAGWPSHPLYLPRNSRPVSYHQTPEQVL